MKKWLVFLSATICVSFSGIFVRLANVSGFVSAFYRIFFALVVIAPAYFARKKRNSLADIIPCVLGGFIFGLELALWNISVVLVNATVPTLLVNLSCIWVGLFSYFALKEKLALEHWIGTIVSISGVCVLIGIAAIIHLRIETGVLYALGCSLMISIYTLIVKKARSRMDSVSALLYTLGGSMIALLLWAVIGKVDIIPKSPSSWYYLAGLGVIVQGLGYLAINYSLGYLSSAKVTLVLLLQPVFTAILAVFLLKERLTANQMAGSVIVMIGLVISFLPRGYGRRRKA